jgi:MFS family permease
MRARIFTEENRKWWTLAAVAFALFMIMLDNTVVNVALPAIQSDLHMSVSALEWVVSGYALTFAVLMLTGGKLADMFGRRLIFVIGLAVFALSSLACGLAGSADLLVAARVVQGVGAAFMMPATLSIISATFPPRLRGTAIGIWAGVSALALAIGPLVGSLITEHINWNWIFYINVPVGLLGIVAALTIIRESKDSSHEQRLDIPGLLTSGISFLAVTFAVIESNRYGWGSPTIVGLFVQAVTEAGEDPEIRRFVRKHMRDVHDFFAETLRRLQEAGGIPADRDPNAEAWVFLGGSLLASFADRLGGLLTDDDFAAIKTQRWRWLSGSG